MFLSFAYKNLRFLLTKGSVEPHPKWEKINLVLKYIFKFIKCHKQNKPTESDKIFANTAKTSLFCFVKQKAKRYFI